MADKRKLKIALPENYIAADKVKMAQQTLERMNKSKLLYGELLKFTQKQSQVAKELYVAGQQVSGILRELGALHPGDMGLVLTDMAAYLSEVDESIKNWGEVLQKELIVPVAKSMDPHLKDIKDKATQIQKKNAAFQKDMTDTEKSVEKAGKQSQTALVEAMKKFNEKKDSIDQQKAELLLDVLLMERVRYIFLLDLYIKPIKSQIDLGHKINELTRDLGRWEAMCNTKDALSVCCYVINIVCVNIS
eukprot:TRINITY_DN7241_c0_g1_i1.p1 TRINITY_DN7241_c0_g1~~TRINITY_DN7241_c0_g1_i1.p1  ORF type:complete len:247 (+),score=59.01 TRINITY_DN7241_c0_g1_i1:20-760(+)